VTLSVRLLGPPRIERDGVVAQPPRGRKAWGVLAYLLLAERPPPRSRIAELLFGDAEDPLGALRWSLAELRRVLGEGAVVRGDPLVLELPAGAVVDLLTLSGPAGTPPGEPPELLTGELLESMSFSSCPFFEAWLLVARRHAAALVQAALRETALARLTAGDPAGATAVAELLLADDPLEPAAHELLIRCLSRGGEHHAARRQLTQSEELLTRLGLSPQELRRAVAPAPSPEEPVGDVVAARAQLAAGRAALGAGAVEPGLACLRLAATEAEACGDDELRGRALGALGAALVHAVRSRDEEGAAVLHEALAQADRSGDRPTAVAALRELGYIDVQAGRVAAAGRWLARATELGRGDDERSAVLGVRGMALSDRAHYPAALALLGESVAAARRCGSVRQAAWGLALLGRVHLLREEFDAAAAVLDESLILVEQESWTAFKPFPEVLRAELDLRLGHPDAAERRIERAFRLSCRLADPCWEGLSLRARGLLVAGRGDPAAAQELLADARARVTRVGDPYQWVHAHVLDALTTVAILRRAPAAPAMAEALARLAGRAGLRELALRAEVHRARLGDPRALATARLLGAEIDNPALNRLLHHTPSHTPAW